MENPLDDTEMRWILEAINHLKHRKARPDLPRISMRMKRKHQIPFDQTRRILDSLIEKGVVVKAVYKNNTSYRDVSKWKKSTSGQIQNSNKMLSRFMDAIREKETEKGTGVTCAEIEEHLHSESDGEKCLLSGLALQNALDIEVSSGFLLKGYDDKHQFTYFINENRDDSMHYEPNQRQLKTYVDAVGDSRLALTTPQDDKPHSSSKHSTHSTHIRTGILSAILSNESTKQQGCSFVDIQKHLSDQCDVSFRNESMVTTVSEHLEQLISENVLKVDGSFYKPSNLIPITEVKTTSMTPSLNTDVEPVQQKSPQNQRTEEEMKVEVLQGLALVPKKSLLLQKKDKDLYPSSLSILPNLSSVCHKNTVGPSRPPSKRKRVMKDHGPDFEIEMPTKTKTKYQSSNSDTKESVYPTPSSSPSSEKAELTLDQSLNNGVAKKKRGRPKKVSTKQEDEELTKVDVCVDDDVSLQSSPSESLSQPAATVAEIPATALTQQPGVDQWTAQQVADYFKDKGYIDEAQTLLNNDIDGAALGLLRRSDVVGSSGTLGVKKLGIALKLFRDIRDLLFRGNAGNYVDPYEEKPFYRS